MDLFEILRRVGEVAYELAVSPVCQKFIMCSMFHILRNYVHVLNQEPLDIDESLAYKERHIRIFGYPSQEIAKL